MAFGPLLGGARKSGLPDPLEEAFHSAMAFPPARARTLLLAPDALAGLAASEAARGPAETDARGFTPGMRIAVLEPARALLSEWRQQRAPFDTRLGPYRADIEAAERLQNEVDTVTRRRDEDLAQIERETEQDHQYRDLLDTFEKADQRARRYGDANGNRQPTMLARYPVYFLALACVGVTEWLINYTTFFLFFGVPAMAAGTTIVLAVLLAFASHGHGSILKQWTHRFGHHAERIKRIADWRLLVLATLALFVVLGAAGGSRYMAALHIMRAQAGPNILGSDVVVQTNPGVEVLLSLLANLAAWLVGIFFAYVAHDIDPDFMDATAQRRRAWRRFHRKRRVVDARVKQTEARYAKELRETETAARSRMEAVAPQKMLLDQLEAHDQAIRDTLIASVRGNAEHYRAALHGNGAGGNAPLDIDRALLVELEP